MIHAPLSHDLDVINPHSADLTQISLSTDKLGLWVHMMKRK